MPRNKKPNRKPKDPDFFRKRRERIERHVARDIRARLCEVAGRHGETDFADLVEASMLGRFDDKHKHIPGRMILSACSTQAEEIHRWPFMQNVKGSAARCIQHARDSVGGVLRSKFGVDAPNWEWIDGLEQD